MRRSGNGIGGKRALRAIVAMLLSIGSAGAGGANWARAAGTIDKEFARPLNLCWNRPATEDRSDIVASDNESVLVFSPSESSIQKLSRNGGKVWQSSLGGTLSTVFQPDNDTYVVVAKTGDNGGLVRAISNATGLTVWERRLRYPIAAASLHSSSARDSLRTSAPLTELRFVSSDGIFRIIDIITGVLIESIDVGTSAEKLWGFLDGHLLRSDEGRWLAIDVEDGVQMGFGGNVGRVTAIVGLGGTNYGYGDASGSVAVSAVGMAKPRWRMRAGGGIEQLLKVGDSLIASSRDNFIYALDIGFGTLQWKRRFTGRLRTLTVFSHYGAVSVVDSSLVEIVDLKNGRKINSIALPGAESVVTRLLLSRNQVALQGESGVYVFSSDCGSEKKRAEPTAPPVKAQ